jgi:hypothetical protein
MVFVFAKYFLLHRVDVLLIGINRHQTLNHYFLHIRNFIRCSLTITVHLPLLLVLQLPLCPSSNYLSSPETSLGLQVLSHDLTKLERNWKKIRRDVTIYVAILCFLAGFVRLIAFVTDSHGYFGRLGAAEAFLFNIGGVFALCAVFLVILFW